jgi:hypothetical protein
MIKNLNCFTRNLCLIVRDATDIQRDTEGVTELCEGKFRWKISTSPEDTDHTNWYPTLSLQSLLTGAQKALSGFADFSNAASVARTNAKRTGE